MFGGETITTIVMIVFSAGLLLFLAWVLIDSLNNKTNKKHMNEEQVKNEPNYLLGGSIVVAAIMVATGLIYSASISAGATIPAGSIASTDSHSAPDQATPAYSQPPAAAPAPRSSGGCGV